MSTRRSMRLLLPALAAASALTLAGCSGTDSGTDTPEPTESSSAETGAFFDMLPVEIQEAGVLRIGVSPSFPPGNFEEDNGEYNGSEIQLAAILAPHLGVEIEHVATNFAGLLSGLQANRFDVILSGMSDTLEREEEATFVNYLSTGTNFLVLEGNPKGIESTDDICGLIAAETIGTSYIDMVGAYSEECVAAGEEPIEVQTFQSGTEVTQAVATGRADFSLASLMANNYFASQSEGALESVGTVLNPQLTGFVVPLGEDELVEALQAALQELVDNGEMAELMGEWGLADQVVEEIQINGATS